MAAVHGSGSSVVLDVNPDMVQEDSINQLADDGNQLNSKRYYRATKGDFHSFEQIDADSLTQLVTRVDENTILHICITAAIPYYQRKIARTESVDFVNQALAQCKELLWQPNKKGETIFTLMKNVVRDTALHEAVRCTYLQVVKILIDEDHCYQYGLDNDGETPPYIATEMGARHVVEEILKCESPDYHGPHGRTTLHAAVLCKNDDITLPLVFQDAAADLHHATKVL
ncbi:hypothetical protein SLEP1_g5635 [Rubroshorea leprosula]|uniref:Uncharacterized protein n=1 Tax=Rubroshorea leprosula TaxID=152421 RepID=A0AAV5HYI5_9ROSI|nr:hypothetical protein SLEP1_g5635 [Rubroshorea leprosula]